MEKVKKTTGYRSLIIIYIGVYLISIFQHQFIWITMLNPGATILAYYGLSRVIKGNSVSRKTMLYVKNAFLIWVLVDLVSTIGELNLYVRHEKLKMFYSFYSIEIILYFIVSFIIFLAVIQLYMGVTRGYNKFQRFADIFTITCCIISTLWIIFFSKGTAESISLIVSLNFDRIISEIFKLLSMMILGTLLISWFHFQSFKITLGQRLILLGIAMATSTNLAVAFYNSLMSNIVFDLIYKVSILFIAIGCETFSLYPTRTFFIKPKNEQERLDTAWKNMFYLFTYPIFAICFVGVRAVMVIYVFLFAFYYIACLYTRQLSIIDQMLQREKEKNEQLRFYSYVVEQVPLSVVVTDIDGNIQYVNPYFSETTGYSMDEAVGKNPRILKSDKNAPELYENLWRNLTSGIKWAGDMINIDKDGNEFQERAVISPMAGEDGKITYYLAIKENITEEQQMKDTIINQSQFITQLADVIPNAIFHVDKEDRFVAANAEFQRLYHVDTKIYNGFPFENTPWMNTNKYQFFIDMREESVRTGKPVIRQIVREASGKETSVLYCVNAYYMTDGSVGGYIGIMTDISELKEKEAELQHAILKANAATEAKSMFLANMSHEIRTPMNAVIGMSYLALKTELTDKQKEYLTKINSAATSLLGIINDILDFSKSESGKIKLEKIEFDLDQVMSKSIEFFVTKAREKDLEFLYHLSCDIPKPLKGDPLRLSQVITNLVGNAVKFTKFGEIRVDISLKEERKQQVCLKFKISDTGIGIAKENQEELFEAFNQSDNSITRQYGGTGLGLAICQNLVEMMGGELWLESELNVGTTFYFTAWFDIPEMSNIRNTVTIWDIKKIKALIVDDNSSAREIMLEYMEHIGIAADVTESGDQAIEMIEKNDKDAPYHLLLIDWKMPNLDGVETVKKMNSMDTLQNKPSVVLVTAYDIEEMKKHASEVEVAAFLAKPVTQSCLYDAIVTIYADSFPVEAANVSYEAEYSLEGTRILLVEDNEVNQQIACELLELQGCIMDVANNGKEAVEQFANQGDYFDLILMDIQMPEMDGFEATRRIRRINQEIPIIAMTARNMQEEKEKCYEAGMNDHIAKPIDPDLLMSIVEQWSKQSLTVIQEANQKKSETSNNRSNQTDNENAIEKLNQIYGLDIQSGLIRVAGNVKLYKKLLYQFATEQQKTVDKLMEESEKNNDKELEEAAHLLKGVAGNVGATSIYDLSAEIEEMAKKHATEPGMKQMIIKMRKEFQWVSYSIYHVIQEEVQTMNQDDAEEYEKEEVLNTLTGLLNKGDVAAVSYFQERQAYLQKIMMEEMFNSLEADILHYEFEDAVKKIQKIKEGSDDSKQQY